VATVQCGDKLGEYTPHEVLFSHLIALFHGLNSLSKIPLLAVFHVDVEIRRGFEVFSLVVGHDIWVPQVSEDSQFCLQLLPFFGRHLEVIDLFTTEDLGQSLLVRA